MFKAGENVFLTPLRARRQFSRRWNEPVSDTSTATRRYDEFLPLFAISVDSCDRSTTPLPVNLDIRPASLQSDRTSRMGASQSKRKRVGANAEQSDEAPFGRLVRCSPPRNVVPPPASQGGESSLALLPGGREILVARPFPQRDDSLTFRARTRRVSLSLLPSSRASSAPIRLRRELLSSPSLPIAREPIPHRRGLPKAEGRRPGRSEDRGEAKTQTEDRTKRRSQARDVLRHVYYFCTSNKV